MRNRNDKRPVLVVIAGAQTGGHLLPAVETGHVLMGMGCDVVLVSSGEAVEKQVLRDAGIPLRTLTVGKIKGMGLIRRIKGLLSVPGAVFRALRMVREMRPDAVAGFGGFTSGPFVLAAFLAGVPTAVFEANSVPGMTNRLLARVVRRVFVTFPGASQRLGRKDAEVTGNPVRSVILGVLRYPRTEAGRRIFVTGGSQGARFLNQNVPLLLAAVARRIPNLEIRHQCGTGNSGSVAAAYEGLGLAAQSTDYVQDMAEAYGWADFVICRSGAGTVSEICAVGIPALFVPFAAAADDHQTANARAVVDSGAALMAVEHDFDTDKVAAMVADVLSSPERLNAMSDLARAAGCRDAADRIAAGIMGMVKR